MKPNDRDIANLKTALRAAASRPMNFGLRLSATPTSTVLLASPVDSGAKLETQAEKLGETSRTASGTMRLESGTPTLTCDDAPAPLEDPR